jgi:hypothetical protein
VLTNSEYASVTTAKHQSDVKRAAQHLPCVAVPCVVIEGAGTLSHQDNLKYFAEQIAEHLAKAKRAMQVSTVDWRTASAQGLHQNALDYSEFFGIRRKVAAFPAAELDAARERAQRIETPDPVRDAAKIRARERKRIATLAAFDLKRARERKAAALEASVSKYRDMRAEYLAAHDMAAIWRQGGSAYLAAPEWWNGAPLIVRKALSSSRRGNWYGGATYGAPVMLRVSGDQIESSMGARIPLEHAPRLWALIQACRSTGRAYAANGHTEHAGPYAIDSVSAEGELKAGCHTIPYAELELMARTLGLPV